MISRYLKLILLIIIAGTIAAYVLLVVIPTQVAERGYKAAKQVGKDFSKTFNFTPEVIVGNTIVLNQQAEILELATISQNFTHQYAWTNTWLNSTKKITIKGSFEAKAGFDLNERFSIRFDESKNVTVLLPEPTILSVESMGDIKFEDENGVWNWVNEENRTSATNAFVTDARRYSEQAEFVKDARNKMEGRIKELLKSYSDSVRFEYSQSAIKPPM
jgi:hypothetical protein